MSISSFNTMEFSAWVASTSVSGLFAFQEETFAIVGLSSKMKVPILALNVAMAASGFQVWYGFIGNWVFSVVMARLISIVLSCCCASVCATVNAYYFAALTKLVTGSLCLLDDIGTGILCLLDAIVTGSLRLICKAVTGSLRLILAQVRSMTVAAASEPQEPLARRSSPRCLRASRPCYTGYTVDYSMSS